MDKIQFSLESFRNIQELIRFIDQKAGAVFVIAGLIFTGFFDFSKELSFIDIKNWTFLSLATFITGTSTVILLICVFYISIFKVLKPSLAKNYSLKEYSLFYYEHLVSLGKENIEKKYGDLTKTDMLKYINDQQFEVSKILNKKTKSLATSFVLLFVAIISFGFFILASTQL